ncbi:MAG: hypothetical protein J5J00_17355 [Deltaproteobacteria bacterium]|nr:hypothetical protein [Deltaproteobacteria bacterium]
MKNLTLKLFSLLIAVMLAYYVHSDSSEGVVAITVPIELKGLPADRIVTSPFPRQVQLSVKGPSFLLGQLYPNPPSMRVKVPPDVGNRFTVTFNKSDVNLPAGIKVISIEPSTMEFTFDTLAKKEVPVQVLQAGSLKSGIKIAEMAVIPSTVSITGPQSELAAIKSIATEAIELGEISADTEMTLELKKVGRWTEFSASEVHLKISLVKEQKERSFADLPVEIRTMQRQAFELEPAKVMIEVSGPKEVINGIKAEAVVPYVKLGPEDAPGKSYQVNVDLPKGVAVVIIEPDKVRVSEPQPPKKK